MAIKIQNSTIIDDSRNLVNVGVGTFVTKVDIGAGGTIFSADANVTNDNILSVKNTSLNPAFDITGTGSVGIGITNPSKSLHIDGTGMLVSSGSTTLLSVETFTDNENVFEVYDRNDNIILGVTTNNIGIGSTNKFTITPQGTGHFIGVGGTEIVKLERNITNSNIFSVLDSQDASIFSITTSGSIGIGTTQPDGVFEIRSNSTQLFNIKDIVSTDIFKILDSGGDPIVNVTTSGIAITTVGLAITSSDGVSIYSTITVYNELSVGVGTTNRVKFIPETTQLSVGIDTTNFLTLGTNTGTEDTFTIYDSTGGLTHFTATNAGNIGVGIANPTEKLHIDGGNVLVSNGSTTIFSASQTGSSILSIEDSAGDSAFEVTSSGSVGIGLSNPTGIFEIQQSGSQLFQVSDSGSNSLSITDASANPAFDVTASGKVGVGVTNPAANFEVVSAGSTVFSVTDTVGDYYLEIDTDKFVVTAAGDVGIGTSNPTSRLHIVGAIQFTDLNVPGISTLGTVQISSGIVTATTGIVTYYGDGSQLQNVGLSLTDDTTTNATRYVLFDDATSGSISSVNVSSTKLTYNPSTGELTSTLVTSSSDERLKENIRTIDDPLNKVLSLRGVEFDRIDNGDHQIGLIAQEVEKVIPQVVYGTDTKTVAYGNLVGLLIEALKEQNRRIDELERRLEEG